jgi:hypothetical protein
VPGSWLFEPALGVAIGSVAVGGAIGPRMIAGIAAGELTGVTPGRAGPAFADWAGSASTGLAGPAAVGRTGAG